MKTPREAEKDETGRYKNSIADSGNLSAEEQREVRKILVSEGAPMHLSALAKAANIALTNPARVQALARYLEGTLQGVGEAEMVFVDRSPTLTGKPRGGQTFIGWRGTPRLKDAIEKGLG
jgi:hypothetical protein